MVLVIVFSIPDYLIAFIGAAYDAFGTNLPLYKYQKQLFDYVFVTRGYRTMHDVIKDYQVNTSAQFDLTKICRKTCVAREELFKGFPSLELLWSMHVLDEVYCDFRCEAKQYTYTAGVEEELYA